MSRHCMIDLETLDTIASAKVLSIGAVVFDENGSIFNTFYRNIDIDDQASRSISHDTLMWWLKQSEAARVALTNPQVKKHLLRTSLLVLSQMIEGYKGIKVWSNGANFDLPILAHAYQQCSLKAAWNFWDERCYRTVKSLHRKVAAPERTGDYHNALDDAKYQAQHLIAIHKSVGGIL